MPPNLEPNSTGGNSNRDAFQRFAQDEVGAAYTLSYVMVIPMYAILICLIIESALMLSAKLGTVYAAYAAARTASVWSSATTWDKALQKAESAAFKTMTSFASGTNLSAVDAAASADAAEDAAYFLAAYQAYANDPVATKYLVAKYAYTQRHVKVKIDGPPATWNANITAKVSYDFPFNVPGIGRILGKRGRDGRYYFTLTSEATLPNEGPQNGRNTIGIGYGNLD